MQELFFKVKPHTKFEKIMNAFCDRVGKSNKEVRTLFSALKSREQD